MASFSNVETCAATHAVREGTGGVRRGGACAGKEAQKTMRRHLRRIWRRGVLRRPATPDQEFRDLIEEPLRQQFRADLAVAFAPSPLWEAGRALKWKKSFPS